MKNTSLAFLKLIVFPLFLSLPLAKGQTTTFTYQGRLTDGGSAFNGVVEFQPTLWSAVSNGTQIAANSPSQLVVSVTNGLFTLPLNFGANFPGADRWLQLEMRTVIGPFTTLAPRQQLTSAPYAITAGNLTGTLSATQLSGTIPATNLSGTYSGALTLNNAANSFSGNGAGLNNLNASALTTGTVPNAQIPGTIARTSQVWLLGGNGGTTAGTQFIGTTDNQPLEFKVNGERLLRIEQADGNPNVIAGSSANIVSAGTISATISGGGATNIGSFPAPNIISGNFGVIAGGTANTISTNAVGGIIGGGYNNRIERETYYGTIAGGIHNDIGTNSHNSKIGGGYENDIGPNSESSTIGGGYQNNIGSNSTYSTIGGGLDNNIGTNAPNATIAGGRFNDITNAAFSFIGGGYDNTIGSSATYSTIGGGRFNYVFQDGDNSVIGGGYGNYVGPFSQSSVIVGGFVNQIMTNNSFSFIGGGHDHFILNNSSNSTIAGGAYHVIGTNSQHATIGGGYNNQIYANSDFATIAGGRMNRATNYAFAAGHRATADHTGAFVWADAGQFNLYSTNANSVTMRASGGYRLFTGTSTNGPGVFLAPGGSAWAVISDRNLKKDFEPLDSRAILEKLAAMPMTQWHYQWEETEATPHIGPMAQDFKAAFYPGRDDKNITTQEADGVALAAIQGLNQKLEEKEAELAALKQRLEKLERLIQSSNP